LSLVEEVAFDFSLFVAVAWYKTSLLTRLQMSYAVSRCFLCSASLIPFIKKTVKGLLQLLFV